MAEAIITQGVIAPSAVYPSSLGTLPPKTGIAGTVTVMNQSLGPYDRCAVGFVMPVYDPDRDEYKYVTYSKWVEGKSVTMVYGVIFDKDYLSARGTEKNFYLKTWTWDWNIEGLEKPYTYGCQAFVADAVNTILHFYWVGNEEREISMLYEDVTIGGKYYTGFMGLNMYDDRLYEDQFSVE